jgi:hypothetical protein
MGNSQLICCHLPSRGFKIERCKEVYGETLLNDADPTEWGWISSISIKFKYEALHPPFLA